MNRLEYDELMTPLEVARYFRVDPKTVTRWAVAGKFPEGSVVRTLGNVRRYKRAAVEALKAATDTGGAP